MSLERRVIANYHLVDEPFTHMSNTFYLNGLIVIAPESSRGDRELVIKLPPYRPLHTEVVDFSRIPHSDKYQGRISARIEIPWDMVRGFSQNPLDEPRFNALLETIYSIIGRVIEDDKKSV